MPVPSKHILAQRHVVGALARAVALSAFKRPKGAPEVPGPEVRMTVSAPSEDLSADFVRLVGGDPGAYKHEVPAHLFPQWAFPAVVRAIGGVPYPAPKIMNAGCTLFMDRPLPRGEPLEVRAQLRSIDDNGRRALITVDVVTSTRSAPDALRADFRMIVPLKGDRGKKGASKGSDKPRIPGEAREIAAFSFGRHTGLDFAKATGDVNPIHWAPRYARAMGFRSVILHGFGSFAWAYEGLTRGLFSGNPRRIAMLDASFMRPLVLPCRAGLYVWGEGQVGLGDAPGGPAYMLGRYEARRENGNGAAR